MKKISKILICLALVLVIAPAALIFAACGQDKVIGEYKAKGIIIEGEEYESSAPEVLLMLGDITEMKIDVKSDGTFAIEQWDVSGNWEAKNNAYIFTVEDESGYVYNSKEDYENSTEDSVIGYLDGNKMYYCLDPEDEIFIIFEK